MNKHASRKLRLSRLTVQRLTGSQMRGVGGAAAPPSATASAVSIVLSATIAMSQVYCTSGDRCVTDTIWGDDPTAAENGCKRSLSICGCNMA